MNVDIETLAERVIEHMASTGGFPSYRELITLRGGGSFGTMKQVQQEVIESLIHRLRAPAPEGFPETFVAPAQAFVAAVRAHERSEARVDLVFLESRLAKSAERIAALEADLKVARVQQQLSDTAVAAAKEETLAARKAQDDLSNELGRLRQKLADQQTSSASRIDELQFENQRLQESMRKNDANYAANLATAELAKRHSESALQRAQEIETQAMNNLEGAKLQLAKRDNQIAALNTEVGLLRATVAAAEAAATAAEDPISRLRKRLNKIQRQKK